VLHLLSFLLCAQEMVVSARFVVGWCYCQQWFVYDEDQVAGRGSVVLVLVQGAVVTDTVLATRC